MELAGEVRLPSRWNWVELFCGIGAFSAAARGTEHSVVAAVDINRQALTVFGLNWQTPTFCRSIESLSAQDLNDWNANAWWLSPPCQPFTRRGAQRDIHDRRSRALERIGELLLEIQPPWLALENVPPFATSQAAEDLRRSLRSAGYLWLEGTICPTHLGIDNRRERFYLVARRDGDWPFASLSSAIASAANSVSRQLKDVWVLRDPAEHHTVSDLWPPVTVLEDYRHAIHVVTPTAQAPERLLTACFTKAYGRSWIRSGSYLNEGTRLRRFTPEEVGHWLGFPSDFKWPNQWTMRQQWALLGNSLSVDVVRVLLQLIAKQT